MKIDNLFSPPNVTQRRKKILKLKNTSYSNPTNDFLSYGYDYFDNKEINSGYPFYKYDSRFKDSVQKIINYFNLTKGDTVADFGCAKGYLLYEFFLLGFNVIGFDISKYAIDNGKVEIKDNLHKIDSELDVKNFEFDFMISRNTLPHLNVNKINNLINISIGKCVYKPYYILTTYSNEIYKNTYFNWDITQETIMNSNQWDNYFKVFYNDLYYSLDILE